MRNRLVAAFVGLTVLVVVLYAVVRVFNVSDLVEEQEQNQLDRAAEQVAVMIAELRSAGVVVDAAALQRWSHEDESIAYTSPDGSTLVAGDPNSDDSDLTSTHAVAGGGSVTLTRSGDVVHDAIVAAVVPMLLIGLGLVLLSVFLAMLLARRLARPFQSLASAAGELGTTSTLEVPHYRIPEAEQIGAALRDSAVRLETLLSHERELAVTASHELRTPITALRLRLEDLALWPQTAPEIAAELQECVAELDRLSQAVTSLLHDVRDHRDEQAIELDLVATVEAAVLRARGSGHDVVVRQGGPVPVRADGLALTRLVNLLVDEACADWSGRVTLALAHLGTHARVAAIREESTGSLQPSPLARELATALGGQCESGRGSSLVVLLPVVLEAEAPADHPITGGLTT